MYVSLFIDALVFFVNRLFIPRTKIVSTFFTRIKAFFVRRSSKTLSASNWEYFIIVIIMLLLVIVSALLYNGFCY